MSEETAGVLSLGAELKGKPAASLIETSANTIANTIKTLIILLISFLFFIN
jgi:hypothetical protein